MSTERIKWFKERIDEKEGLILERLKAQGEAKSQREYPQGRISGDDEGSLAFAVMSDPVKNVVIVDFNKAVVWFGMSPADVRNLIELLERHCAELESTAVS